MDREVRRRPKGTAERAELARPNTPGRAAKDHHPTLVAIGDQDERSDAGELAALLPNARFVRVPGDHGTAFAAPELTAAIAAFLAER